jgi:PleD family two-component response regulator
VRFTSRFGGDEFAIAFDLGTNLDDAIAVGNRIVASLEQPFQVTEFAGSVGITASVNVGDTFAAIIERADKARCITQRTRAETRHKY